MDSIRISAGKALKLGTTVTAKGVYFTVFSRNAKKMYLDLYSSAEDAQPYHTVELNPETSVSCRGLRVAVGAGSSLRKIRRHGRLAASACSLV